MKFPLAFILGTIVLVLGGFFLFQGKGSTQSALSPSGSNVVIVDGQQIVTINVKGGYVPEVSSVKAGIPTTLRFETNGTFDCSGSVRISSLGINKTLPSSGTTDINIGTLSQGTLQGTCSMGMYQFQIQAQG